jgi:YHS domain-containing protein
MNAKKKALVTVLLVAGFLLAGLIVVDGCKKSEPEPTPPTEQLADAVAATIEQTTCPVMDGAINKELYTEYKGKKVYFCCPGCKEKFEENPENYIAKLPQFQQ